MAAGKVLFQTRPDLFDNFGGDTVQIIRTKSELERLGLKVEISFDPAQELDGFDIVHVFNLLRPVDALQFIRNARSQRKLIALSPVYWNTSEFEEKGRFVPPWRTPKTLTGETSGEIERLRKLRRSLERSRQKLSLILSDIVLPLADAERSLLVSDFGLGNHRFRIVHNGGDLLEGPSSVECPSAVGHLRDYVLCPGRIEDRKNQLGLIRAMRSTGLSTVIVGAAPNAAYFYACQQAADDKVVFLPQMPAPELAAAYRAAKVVATPSWFEVAALANLEAGLAGCHIATTDRSSAREYFGELASYCDPSDIESIRRSVLSEYQRPRDGALKDLISGNYTWRKAAEETVEAYEYLLSNGPRPVPLEEEEHALSELREMGTRLAVAEALMKAQDTIMPTPRCSRRPGLSRFAGLRYQVYRNASSLTTSVLRIAGNGLLGHLSQSIAPHLLVREHLSYNRAFYSASTNIENPPEMMKAGRTYWLRTGVRNTGGLTWGAADNCADPVNLAYRWRDSSGRLVIRDGARTPLPFDLPAGREITLLTTVIAPPTPGAHTLEMHLVHESVAWFEDQGLSPVRLNVRVCE